MAINWYNKARQHLIYAFIREADVAANFIADLIAAGLTINKVEGDIWVSPNSSIKMVKCPADPAMEDNQLIKDLHRYAEDDMSGTAPPVQLVRGNEATRRLAARITEAQTP